MKRQQLNDGDWHCWLIRGIFARNRTEEEDKPEKALKVKVKMKKKEEKVEENKRKLKMKAICEAALFIDSRINWSCQDSRKRHYNNWDTR